MKVFEFDSVTGTKGRLIEEIARPDQTGNPAGFGCVLPRDTSDAEWRVVTEVKDRSGMKLTWDRPVCFCMGKFSAGEDSAWWWCVYLPWSGEQTPGQRSKK